MFTFVQPVLPKTFFFSVVYLFTYNKIICHGNGKSWVIGKWWTTSISSGSLSFMIIIPDSSDAHFHLPGAYCGVMVYAD